MNRIYNSTPYPREIEIVQSLEGAIKSIREFSIRQNSFLAFRGHADIAWDVSPSIFRQKAEVLANEGIIIREMISRYPDSFNHDTTMLDKLVRMQHFGLPTRLLDVTRNPLVALYFATEQAGQADEDGALIFMEISQKRRKYFDSDTISCISNLANLSSDEKISLETTKANNISDFRKINAADRLYQFIREEKPHFRFRIRRSDLFKPYYVIPKMNNNRIIAQSGAFIAFGLEWRSDPSPEKGIWNYSIRIPKGCKGSIREDLKLLGIHSGTIFPELEKAAAEIVRDLSS